MSRRPAFLLCAFPALSTVLFASDEKTPAAPVGESATETASARGLPALFSWADIDGDGRLDLAAVSGEGKLQILANTGEGRFEDVTEHVGLSEVENAALALWADYDGDGRLDLFVGAREGKSQLFKNDGGTFVDMSAGSGLSSEGAVESAHWLDHDGDGMLDLHVSTAERNELFRGLEGGLFELSVLPLAGAVPSPLSGELLGSGETDEPSSSALPEDGESGGLTLDGPPVSKQSSPDFGRTPGGKGLGGWGLATMPGPACLSSIEDQANPGSCLMASTTPALGRLYPLSANLFVAVGGNVGIGTTSPSAKLDVAGTARVTDTLTLAPSGDQALDVSTGSIYKGGALFIHTQGARGGPTRNTAIGTEALGSLTIGGANTASGYRALFSNTIGFSNTASGDRALFSNTTGGGNTASGYRALFSNTTGGRNTASGFLALFSNTTGAANTASGDRALFSNTTGDRNTANGTYALFFNTTGVSNTGSGHGALSSNTTGVENTAIGSEALRSNTTGYDNTATGSEALRSNTTGYANTASGYSALFSNTTGAGNTASGAYALSSNTIGDGNTASGWRALFSNTSGYNNTAIGFGALDRNTTGTYNIAIGFQAGSSTTGSRNIFIGSGGETGDSHTLRIGIGTGLDRAFIDGIHGVTTGNSDAIPVLIDSNGQLGTTSSSRRFKEEIRDMGGSTDRLLELRPVVFRYKPEVQQGERPLEYGLIAEEVAEVFPDLVVYDEEGQPFTVKYHVLSSMLLNELQKLHQRLAAQRDEHASELEELRSDLTRLCGLEARLAAVEAQTSADALPAATPLGVYR